MCGNSFPISVVTTGLHPILNSFHLPTCPTPLPQPQLQTPCAIQGHNTGAPFLPSNQFQAQVTDTNPKLLHLASQTPWCKPLQHMASTALGITVQMRETLLTCPREQYCWNHRLAAAHQPHTRIKSGLLQLSLRVTRSVSPRMLTPNTHGLNVN